MLGGAKVERKAPAVLARYCLEIKKGRRGETGQHQPSDQSYTSATVDD